MVIEATLPMKPFLKQYVLWKENLGPNDLLNLSKSSSEISWILAGCLTQQLQYNFDKERKLPAMYSADLRFKINTKRVQHNIIYFSPAQIRYFNTYVYRRMHDQLLERILRGKYRGISEVDIIWEFMYESGIEPFTTFEALKKANYRLRKGRKIPLFR